MRPLKQCLPCRRLVLGKISGPGGQRTAQTDKCQTIRTVDALPDTHCHAALGLHHGTASNSAEYDENTHDEDRVDR